MLTLQFKFVSDVYLLKSIVDEGKRSTYQPLRFRRDLLPEENASEKKKMAGIYASNLVSTGSSDGARDAAISASIRNEPTNSARKAAAAAAATLSPVTTNPGTTYFSSTITAGTTETFLVKMIKGPVGSGLVSYHIGINALVHHYSCTTSPPHIIAVPKPTNAFLSVQPSAHFKDLQEKEQQQLQQQQGGRATGTAVHLPPTADVGSPEEEAGAAMTATAAAERRGDSILEVDGAIADPNSEVSTCNDGGRSVRANLIFLFHLDA